MVISIDNLVPLDALYIVTGASVIAHIKRATTNLDSHFAPAQPSRNERAMRTVERTFINDKSPSNARGDPNN
ncbi:MAG: hypothetical protein MSG64_08100 [Pyrinomonadaceae bacterium MAG19_C2-C3]|nr:hypothetical protein [Pyrinomonadaceae bacterium MAG19_C2-C3]